jgi:hypothetical protein
MATRAIPFSVSYPLPALPDTPSNRASMDFLKGGNRVRRKIRGKPAWVLSILLGMASSYAESGAFSERELTIGPVLGVAYAPDGDHGGAQLGALMALSSRHLDLYGGFQVIQEWTPPLASKLDTPEENYFSAEIGTGLKIPLEPFVLSGGIGAGVFAGRARTAWVRSDTACAMSFFSDECRDPTITNRYESQGIATLSANPYLRLDCQVSSNFGMGAMYKAIINDRQGLGVVSLVFYYGSRLREGE